MADIKPFRAWRYNPDKIQDINLKFSPLFDVVSEKQLEALYHIPNNSIHLSVPRSIEAAHEKLQAWKEDRVIRQDPLPAIYIYYQFFTLYGETRPFTRKGFISMIRLREEDIILHEDTMTHSVEERVRLLELTKLNVAPTHGLFQDTDFELEALMDVYMEHPLYEYIDYQGVINKLAIVQDPQDIQIFVDKLGNQPVYLADGHHRLASSYAYRDQLAASGHLHPKSVVNYHLMYLTNLHSDGLQILPTHRVYCPEREVDIPQIRERLSVWFELTDVSRSRQPLFDALVGRPNSFGLVSQGRQWVMQLRPELDLEALVDLPLPGVLKRLGYTLLHYLVFDRVLGIPYSQQHKSPLITYEKDYAAAISRVNKGQAALSFITQGVSMQEMLEVCETGYKMPQKSTYFYPKVVCGLVFGSIDEYETQSAFDTGFSISQKGTAPSGGRI